MAAMITGDPDGFDPRSRAGSVAAEVGLSAVPLVFRSALPRGERRALARGESVPGWFRSALPRGERPVADDAAVFRPCFDPRSRAGSVNELSVLEAEYSVSIRAPARGASAPPWPRRPGSRCFDPRSRAGSVGTHDPDWTVGVFRSALPRGERRSRLRHLHRRQSVSIRAPARGASAGRHRDGSGVPRFDPRSRAGSVCVCRAADRCSTGFDPRSRAGSVARGLYRRWRERCFDPRSRAGSVSRLRLLTRDDNVSIRAPARGASPCFFCKLGPSNSFDPRSRAGSVEGDALNVSRSRCFDPRSRAGSVMQSGASVMLHLLFRSALPRGERPRWRKPLSILRMFRSALPRGERRIRWYYGLIPYTFRSALPRGERRREGYTVESICEFRSALPRGERHLRWPSMASAISESFDPRSRAGSVPAGCLHALGAVEFRSALPRGERQQTSLDRSPKGGFDPRSRAGSVSTRRRCCASCPFRSALPRGERLTVAVGMEVS